MSPRFIPLALGALLLLGTPTLVQAQGPQDSMTHADKSLYDRLGGKAAISAVVDEFVTRVAGDDRINKFFAATAADPARLKAFKGKLVDQICEASGGPCKYMGKDMKTAHQGMGVSGADFGALVQDLVGALDKFKVPEKEKSELLGALGPMQSQIVEKR
ncbi:MAG: group 1 truncated hemoglobin [Gemmatimonadaceae bacterium]